MLNEDASEKRMMTGGKIAGKVPVAVVSMTTGLPADRSFEVPAAMLANAACPAVGLVNFVTVTVTTVAAMKVPAVSFTVNNEPANVAEHEGDPEAGAMTAQALVASTRMPAPDSVMTIPALAAAVMACVGVNEIVAVVCAALTEEASVIARPVSHEIAGKVPVAVVSMTTGLPADRSFEVPAAMLANAACPAVGLVNFVTVTVTTVAALKVPAVSFTVNNEPANVAEHEGNPEAGAMTAQALVASTRMPAPDSVMTIPALAAAVMACVGVNEIAAVVCAALTEEASVIARPVSHEIAGKVPDTVVSMTTGMPADRSFEVPAAMLANAACPLVGVRNLVRVKTEAVFCG